MISSAVIPLAGRATRMRPISRAVPKGLLPLVAPDGRVRAVAHFICAEARAAGVGRVALVVAPGDEARFREYFAAARDCGDPDLPETVEYVPAEPKGFGHAVARCESFVAGRPFLLMLGDHVYRPEAPHRSCAGQVVRAFASHGGAAMVGVQVVGPEALARVGAVAGEDLEDGVYRCTAFVEKPTPAQARALRTSDLPAGRFLAHAGLCAFTPEIFDCLREVAGALPAGDELELAAAQHLLLSRHPEDYHLLRLAGRAFDTGAPAAYAEALRAFAAP